MLLSKHKILADTLHGLLTQTPRAVSQGGETQTRAQRALSTPQPLNTSSAYPLKINHAGKPPSQTLASYVSTHAPHSAGSSLETSPPLFQEADVRMAAIRHDASRGNVEAITLTVEDMEERWDVGASSAVAQSWLRWHSAKLKSIWSVPYQQHMALFCQPSESWVGHRLQVSDKFNMTNDLM